MAIGDIVSLTVLSDGWSAELVIEGFSTGSTFNSGTAANNAPSGNESVVLTVTSLGFDSTGAATTRTRRVYAVTGPVRGIVRQPYPNQTLAQESVGGGNLTIRLALSEAIFAKDKAGVGNSGTDIVATVSANAVTNSGGVQQSNVRSGFTVTNNSVIGYPKVIGRWAWPPRDRVTTDFLVEAVCFHQFGQNGNPVACVQFDATDGTNSISTITVTAMSVSTRTGDANKVAVYPATIPVVSLNTNSGITCQFKAFPWIGDSASTLDTRVGADGTAPPTENLGPWNVFLDKADNRAVYASVVTGAVGGTAQLTAALARTTPFPTIAAALTAVRTLNNSQNGRNTLDACVLLMQNGTYTGPGTFTGSNTLAWCVIQADLANGATEAGVIISTATNQVFNAWVKVQDVTLTGAGAGLLRGSATTGQLWIHSCSLSATSTSAWYAWRVAWATQNTVTAVSINGFGPFSTNRCPFAIIRGNDASAVSAAMFGTAYSTLGNKGVRCNTQETGNTAGNSISDNGIYAWNSVYALGGSGFASRVAPACFETTTIVNGFAFIGNIGERITSGEPMVQFCGDNSLNPAANIIMINNTIVGQRCNVDYLEFGTTNVDRINWCEKYNMWEDFNCKTDTFVTDPNGVRVKNWDFMNGTGDGWSRYSTANFPRDSQAAGTAVVGSAAAMGYTSNQSLSGTNTGNGNYYLTSTSPGRNLIPAGKCLVPFDLAGNRFGNDGDGSAGALQRTQDLSTAIPSTFFFAL